VYSQGSVVVLARQDLVNAPTEQIPELNEDFFKAAAPDTTPEGARVSTTEMKEAQPDDGIREFLLSLPDNVECTSTQFLVLLFILISTIGFD
jgi:hypothetical protein